jgi:hypothetical protein
MSNAALSISDELAALGVGHRPSKFNSKRECFRIDTGEIIGDMDAKQASEFIAGLRQANAWAAAFKAACDATDAAHQEPRT